MANQGTGTITFTYSTNGGSSYTSSGSYYCHYRVQTKKNTLYDRMALSGAMDTRAFTRRYAVVTIPAVVVMANEAAIDLLKSSDFLKLTLSGQADFDGTNEWKVDDVDYDYESDNDKGKTVILSLTKKTIQ